jgi:hypothetical protein
LLQPGAKEAVLDLIERSPSDSNESRKLLVAFACESLGDIPAHRIRRIVQLRSQLEIRRKGAVFRESEDLLSKLVSQLPDDQLGEMTGERHSPAHSTRCAGVLSMT